MSPSHGSPRDRAGDERDETSQQARAEAVWHQTWTDDIALDEPAVERAAVVDDAEQALLKRLRSRSLSVREARAALAQAGLDPAEVDAVTARFEGNRYLDDTALAEQLLHKGIERKGQGRQAVALSLAQRGIPRDVVDAALAGLPDDDADRALEFARSKVRAMAGLDRDVALRRLAGQLARRGYGSGALSAARQALDEIEPARRPVRFE